jgi:hypothetical protein
MAGFQFQLDESAALSASAGGMTTGVYEVVVEAVVLGEDKSGNPRASFYFADANGKRAIVFDMCIAPKWTTGKDNSDFNKWQEFAMIVGMKTGATAVQNVQISKDKKEDKTVFAECSGKKIKVALQEVNDIVTGGAKIGQPKTDKRIYRTFYTDGRTLAEKTSDVPAKTILAVEKDLKPYSTPAFKAKEANGTNGGEIANGPDEETSADSDEDLI